MVQSGRLHQRAGLPVQHTAEPPGLLRQPGAQHIQRARHGECRFLSAEGLSPGRTSAVAVPDGILQLLEYAAPRLPLVHTDDLNRGTYLERRRFAADPVLAASFFLMTDETDDRRDDAVIH